MSTVECDLSNGFDYTKQIEQDVFRGANDLYSRDDGDGSSSSGIVTDENVVDRTRSAQLLSGTHVNAEQTEQLNGNEKMHSCRKTRVINTPAYHKPLNRSEVQGECLSATGCFGTYFEVAICFLSVWYIIHFIKDAIMVSCL